ncbi:MAG: Major Facilitator Superfamily protein [Blastococcus sp.]|nr:Major Facilitator Superfamily protein [Blastococcus sp.]
MAAPPPGNFLAVAIGLLSGFSAMGSAGAAVVLPSLSADLGVTTVTSTWVISGFSLAYGVSMAVYGRLADLFGMRVPLAGGASLMAVGAVAAAAAPTYEMLVAARLVQGAGAAAIPVLGMAVVSRQYGLRARPSALGVTTGVSTAIACVGPLIGGALDELLGWRSAIALPAAGLLVVAMIWPRLPTDRSGRGLDVLGAVLVATSATGLILLLQSATTGPVAAVVGALLLTSGLPWLVLRVPRVPNGFLPLAMVTHGPVVRATVAATAAPIAWFSLLVAVPIVLAEAGWEPLRIGVALLPSALVGLVAPRLSGRLLQRRGPARSLVLAARISTLALAVAAIGAGLGEPVPLVLGVTVVTVALGLGHPALIAAIANEVPEEIRGVALGLAIMTFFLGGAVGTAIVGGFAGLLQVTGCLVLLSGLTLLVALPVRPRDNGSGETPERPGESC